VHVTHALRCRARLLRVLLYPHGISPRAHTRCRRLLRFWFPDLQVARTCELPHVHAVPFSARLLVSPRTASLDTLASAVEKTVRVWFAVCGVAAQHTAAFYLPTRVYVAELPVCATVQRSLRVLLTFPPCLPLHYLRTFTPLILPTVCAPARDTPALIPPAVRLGSCSATVGSLGSPSRAFLWIHRATLPFCGLRAATPPRAPLRCFSRSLGFRSSRLLALHSAPAPLFWRCTVNGTWFCSCAAPGSRTSLCIASGGYSLSPRLLHIKNPQHTPHFLLRLLARRRACLHFLPHLCATYREPQTYKRAVACRWITRCLCHTFTWFALYLAASTAKHSALCAVYAAPTAYRTYTVWFSLDGFTHLPVNVCSV